MTQQLNIDNKPNFITKTVNMTQTKTAPSAKTGASTKKSAKQEKGTKDVLKHNLAQTAKDKQKQDRESKYLYPDNCTSTEKKEFRRQARQQRAKYEKELKGLKKKQDEASKKEFTKMSKEFNSWMKATYSNAA